MTAETQEILQRIAATPGCSVEPGPIASGQIPEACPTDIRDFLAVGRLLLHCRRTADGSGTYQTDNSFEFEPRFRFSLANDALDGPEDLKDPDYAPFAKCFRLGYFGEGNSVLALDLSQPDRPLLRHVFWYPAKPLADYKVIPFSFSAFLREVIELGPDRGFLDTHIYRKS